MDAGLSAVIAALATAAGSVIIYKIKRKDQKNDKNEDKEDVTIKALRYIMLYIIQERAKTLISQRQASLDDRRSLRHWHDLYHNGLGGNGDADALMDMVDELPISDL